MPPACFLNAPTAALPRLDERRGRQYLPLPREQEGCSFLRTGVVPRRGQTLCPLLGVFFCFVFLHGQENEGQHKKVLNLRREQAPALRRCNTIGAVVNLRRAEVVAPYDGAI